MIECISPWSKRASCASAVRDEKWWGDKKKKNERKKEKGLGGDE